MELMLLGSGGYHPTESRQTLCLMIPRAGLLLDAGTGLFRAAKHVQTESLDILLSHAHLDHVIGLTFLFDLVHVAPVQAIRVHGLAEKLNAIREHLWHPALFPVPPPCELVPLQPNSLDHLPCNVSHFPVRHPGGAIGYRLDFPDCSIGYVTDTTADGDAGYVDAIRGVDCLIHECYFSDDQAEAARRTGHSWTTAVAHVARQADVGNLVLVHMNPIDPNPNPVNLDKARAIFPQTEFGHDGMTWQPSRSR